ncbi:TPA: hypothetical protein DF272_03010 [Candidatus Falkowbacteria bacterium]|nr:hypothetical protein [Candidatus Falkowbacteria bacterium]
MAGSVKVDVKFECPVCGGHEYYPPVTVYQREDGLFEYQGPMLNGKRISEFQCLSCSVGFRDLVKFGTLRQRQRDEAERQRESARSAAKDKCDPGPPYTRGRDLCLDRCDGCQSEAQGDNEMEALIGEPDAAGGVDRDDCYKSRFAFEGPKTM